MRPPGTVLDSWVRNTARLMSDRSPGLAAGFFDWVWVLIHPCQPAT